MYNEGTVSVWIADPSGPGSDLQEKKTRIRIRAAIKNRIGSDPRKHGFSMTNKQVQT